MWRVPAAFADSQACCRHVLTMIKQEAQHSSGVAASELSYNLSFRNRGLY